jgi:hypothetical protein
MCLGGRLVTRRANLPLVATLLRGMDSISVHQAIASDINTGRLIHTFSNSTLHQLMQLTTIANGLICGGRQYIQNRSGKSGLCSHVYKELRAIQDGNVEDQYGWMWPAKGVNCSA